MKTCNAYLSVLLAGLLTAAGVQAQSTSASGSSDTPSKAGEASTQTHGVPNAKTTNSPDGASTSKDAARQGAKANSASTTTDVPGKAGEASTMTQGAPNAKTTNSPDSTSTSKDAARQGAKANSASTTTSVPNKAGEASTTVQGQPNANPDDPAKNKGSKSMGNTGSGTTTK
jgi:hypothetical protein